MRLCCIMCCENPTSKALLRLLLTKSPRLSFSWLGGKAASSVGAGLGQRVPTWQAWHARACSQSASGD